MGWAATTDPTMSQTFTFATNINVSKGDVIVLFQWQKSAYNKASSVAPADNLGSAYTELGGNDIVLGGTYVCDPPSDPVVAARAHHTDPTPDPVVAARAHHTDPTPDLFLAASAYLGNGGAYYTVAPAAGQLSVTFNWDASLYEVPGYAVYVLGGQKFNGNIYYPNSVGNTATGNSVSITTSGLPKTTYHYALFVAYVGNNTCLNAVPSISAQGFKQALTWGDSCYEVCSASAYSFSQAVYFAYIYSAKDFTFDLQFSYGNTTYYGYAIVLV